MKEEIAKKDIPKEKIYVTGIPLSNRFLENFDREKIKKLYNLDLNKRTILSGEEQHFIFDLKPEKFLAKITSFFIVKIV